MRAALAAIMLALSQFLGLIPGHRLLNAETTSGRALAYVSPTFSLDIASCMARSTTCIVGCLEAVEHVC